MNNLDIENKRIKEKKILAKMIVLYCKKKHGSKATLCKECEELRDYAFIRSDLCPFMETKTFCNNCRVHCYNPEMREKIRAVMRFSGIRLLFRNPIMVTQHLILSLSEKRQNKKNQEK